MMSKLHPETLAVRGAEAKTDYNEHNSALMLTSSFMFDSAADGAALFAGERDGFTYSRTDNPTVRAFQQRVAQLEQAETGLATSTGMAAITSAFLALVRPGEHIVASRSLFGTTIGLLNTVLPQSGISVTFVGQSDIVAWEDACTAETTMLFVETPSNPLNEPADIEALAAVAHRHGALLMVDNSFCSPAVQQPLRFGADLSVQSATKAIDGHGRMMGGVLCGSRELVEKVFLRVRTTGEVLSPFNAWVLLGGLETLFVRMEKQSESALALAQFLQRHEAVENVFYTALSDHPGHALAAKQQSSGGIVIGFTVRGGQDAAWQVIDTVSLFSRTANLGDVKSTITHPWTTTHGRMAPEAKTAAGIVPGLLRISVGLEHADDLMADLKAVLDTL